MRKGTTEAVPCYKEQTVGEIKTAVGSLLSFVWGIWAEQAEACYTDFFLVPVTPSQRCRCVALPRFGARVSVKLPPFGLHSTR
jgi:hypothetical protein